MLAGLPRWTLFPHVSAGSPAKQSSAAPAGLRWFETPASAPTSPRGKAGNQSEGVLQAQTPPGSCLIQRVLVHLITTVSWPAQHPLRNSDVPATVSLSELSYLSRRYSVHLITAFSWPAQQALRSSDVSAAVSPSERQRESLGRGGMPAAATSRAVRQCRHRAWRRDHGSCLGGVRSAPQTRQAAAK